MPIILKSKAEVENIRQSGRILADILAELRMAVRPGIRTSELEELAATLLRQCHACSSTLGYVYEGFSYPVSLCTSVNDEVIHGIPGARVLREGDILTLDLVAEYRGWHADAAITVPVGAVSPEVRRLISVSQQEKKYPLDKIAYVCYNSQLAAAVTNCCTVLSRNHQLKTTIIRERMLCQRRTKLK